MSVTIRPATRDDVPGVLAIYNEAITASTASWDLEPIVLSERLERFDAQSAAGYPLLVAERSGVVIGFASYGPFRAKAGYARTMEHSVYLDASARGIGLGTQLMEALIVLARASGVHALIAGLDASNEPSLRLHEKLGFAEVGRLRQVGAKFGRWLDLTFLELLLDDAPAPRS